MPTADDLAGDSAAPAPDFAADFAAQSRDDPTGWFEKLYAAARDGWVEVPWDRGAPNQLLVDWAGARCLAGDGRRAIVVGCGLGRDAEYLSGLGFDTTAFDIAPTAVQSARRRHPQTTVRYVVADLFALPSGWLGGFDFVLESMTVQALPLSLRTAATVHVGQLVAPGGTLLVLTVARPGDSAPGDRAPGDSAPGDGPPWPLSRGELDGFGGDGLRPVRVEELPDATDPQLHRFRAEFRAEFQAESAPTSAADRGSTLARGRSDKLRGSTLAGGHSDKPRESGMI